jgi:hypothetical protein
MRSKCTKRYVPSAMRRVLWRSPQPPSPLPRAPPAPTGRTELEPLHLDDDQLDALEAFLQALDSEG